MPPTSIGQAAITARQVSDTATNARAFGDALEFRAAAVSGVNVDEEMSRLVQLQKAYTVSARIIAATDEMFDELFRAAQ
jgi:flagellar hook-associated protein 1 FlgK